MICDTFKKLAINTWESINQSRKVNFQLKEETFTDLNMLAIKQIHPLNVRTKVFTKYEEGQNGADWEWWFRNAKNQWIGFRVQAKILNISSDEFEHLHYQSPTTKIFQCDKLIKKALTRTAPMIPLYCFYLQTNDNTKLTHWNCHSYHPANNLWGCSLTSAFSVKKLRPALKRHLTDLELRLRPWHCLVCCGGYGGGNNIERISSYSIRNFELDRDAAGGLEVVIPDTFITERPPIYVLNILENENNDNIVSGDEDLRGVLIYTFNENEQEQNVS